MLFEIGLPERDTVVDAARSIRGSDILALISPVLQRCVVQVRQTLRFGLDEGARTHARLRVEGPGSRIPGLAEMISEETGLPLDGVGETGAAFDAPGHPDGDLMTAVRSTPRDVNLVPGDVARCQRAPDEVDARGGRGDRVRRDRDRCLDDGDGVPRDAG
ncbi:MAG: hypothetical protein R3B46_11690 [Phycisphaerales bacterium]